MRFTFIIKPATIHNRRTGNRHYYPAEREELVETVLRSLAVEENPNFIKDDLVLMFDLRYFLERLGQVSKKRIYPSEEIQLALDILTSTQFELHNGSTELSFHAIEELRRVPQEEDIFYYVRFNYMFLGDNQIFDYSFGDVNPNKFRSGD